MSNDKMKTPRTDAQPSTWENRTMAASYATVPAEFARQLETELISAQQENARLREALEPLDKITKAYHDNELDYEARKFWGLYDEHENHREPKNIKLYSNKNKYQLLTLQHCFDASKALSSTSGESWVPYSLVERTIWVLNNLATMAVGPEESIEARKLVTELQSYAPRKEG